MGIHKLAVCLSSLVFDKMSLARCFLEQFDKIESPQFGNVTQVSDCTPDTNLPTTHTLLQSIGNLA